MPEWLTGTFGFLVDMNLHPMVTGVVFIVLLVSRIRFELPHIAAARDAVEEAAKSAPDKATLFLAVKAANEKQATRFETMSYILGIGLSIGGQFALYWPKSGQARALCIFFSFAQFFFAAGSVWFIEKFGLIDRLGKYFQKRVDDKIGQGSQN